MIFEKMVFIFYTGLLGALGGMARLFYKAIKGEKFVLWMWVTSIGLSFLIGWIAGELIPRDWAYRDGMIAVVGVASIETLHAIEVNATKWVDHLVEGLIERLTKRKAEEDRDESDESPQV